MGMSCPICESKESEIQFLRQSLTMLLEARKIEQTTYTPMYTNDMGDLVTSEVTDAIEEEKNTQEGVA